MLLVKNPMAAQQQPKSLQCHYLLKHTHHNRKRLRDQKKKQIRIKKKTNKDDRSENRPETAEREDQKKQLGIHMNKNERE